MTARNQRRQLLVLSISAATDGSEHNAGARAGTLQPLMVPPLPHRPLATTASDTTTLKDIKVTAQKRVEYLQDVPITMTTFNTQQLHDAGVHDIKELQILVPDLDVSSSDNTANTTARIRGVGTIGDNAGLESSGWAS